MEIEGTIALVTGANRGIGKAFADALLERGAAKVYAGARDIATVRTADPRLIPVSSTSPTPTGSPPPHSSSATSSLSSTTRASPVRRPRSAPRSTRPAPSSRSTTSA